MNKSDLIVAVSDRAGLTRADAERAVNASFDLIKDALVKGEKVTIVGFGAFSVAERAAREGRNPKTGAAIKIAATRAAKFKPAAGLKDSL